MKRLIYMLLLWQIGAVLLMALSACRHGNEGHREAVGGIVGKEIVIPDSMEFRINGRLVSNIAPDYTILAYIDSSECTPCMMRLREWGRIIDEFKSLEHVDVDFKMIVNSVETEKIAQSLRTIGFGYPICFDSEDLFNRKNSLPEGEAYHTLLVNSDNEVLIVGNPAVNPKILDLYRKVIAVDSDGFEPVGSYSFGTANPGDTVAHQFAVRNHSRGRLTVQGIVPSCDCVNAYMNTDVIDKGRSAILTVKYVVDGEAANVKRYVDVYFHEKDTAERYALHGYLTNDCAYKQ